MRGMVAMLRSGASAVRITDFLGGEASASRGRSVESALQQGNFVVNRRMRCYSEMSVICGFCAPSLGANGMQFDERGTEFDD